MVRRLKCSRIHQTAVDAIEKGIEVQTRMSPETIEEQKKVWATELQSLDLVLLLYRRGLSAHSVAHLTQLPAQSWISEDTLPVKMFRAGLDLRQRDYAIPKRIDPDSAYLIGAYFASTRVYTEA